MRSAITGPKKYHHTSITRSSPVSCFLSTTNPCSLKIFAARSTAADVSGVALPSAALSKIPIRNFCASSTFTASTGTGTESASPASGPAITANKARTSETVRAIGPTTPIQPNAPPPSGKCPVAGILPGVGFNPQIPQKCAGTRIDPPPSLPTPPAEHPDAIAAASPPLDPPDVRDGSQGLLVRPYRRLSVSHAMSNSGVLVVPKMIAPALRRRDTNGAS